MMKKKFTITEENATAIKIASDFIVVMALIPATLAIESVVVKAISNVFDKIVGKIKAVA